MCWRLTVQIVFILHEWTTTPKDIKQELQYLKNECKVRSDSVQASTYSCIIHIRADKPLNTLSYTGGLVGWPKGISLKIKKECFNN